MASIASAKLFVPDEFRRGHRGQRELTTAEESGIELLELMRQRLNLADYANSSLLDIGCGTRIPEALINRRMPIRRYVGMDLDAELIGFLNTHVDDQRFEFFRLDLYNRLYNPKGKPLTPAFALPLSERFDVGCLFSVFTHLDPRDADCMLGVLRRYTAESGKLIFTCFLDESVSGFDDRVPDRPLLQAAYNKSLFEHLISRNGWAVESLYPPTKSPLGYTLMQDCYVCRPV
jgi:SAM-dependent methyltransferase